MMAPEFQNSQFLNSLNSVNPLQMNDDGEVRPKTLITLTAIASLGGLLLGANPGYTMDQDSSSAAGEITKVSAVNFECRALVEANLDVHARNKLTVFHRQLPGTGYEASLSGIAEMIVCMDHPKVKNNVTDDGRKQNVVIDAESVQFKTRYEEERTQVTQETPSVSAIGEGLSSLLHGLTSTLTGGYSDKIIEEHIQGQQAKIDQSTRVAGVETMEKKCSEAGWKLIVRAINKSYDEQAAEQGIDPADVNVRFEGRLPNWKKLYTKTHPVPSKDDPDGWGYSTHIDNQSCSVNAAAGEGLER